MATHQEKLAAKQYVDGVGVMPVLEEMLNDLGRSKPADPVGFCAGFLLSRQAQPTVSRLAIREAINSAGKPAVRVSCIACVRNQDTVLASASAPSLPVKTVQAKGTGDGGAAQTSWQCQPTGHRTPVQLVDANDERHNRMGVAGIAAKAEPVLSAAVAGMDICDQAAVDGALWSADPTERKSDLGGNVLTAASLAVLQSAAVSSVVSLHRHVCLTFDCAPAKHMPIPIATVFSGVGATDGKMKARSISIHPSRFVSLREGLEVVTRVFAEIQRAVVAKGRNIAGNASACGALAPNMDRPEQGLDYIKDACSACGVVLGTDVFPVLDLGGSGYYDATKGKYDGKDREAYLADLWSICDTYKVSMVVDPLSADDAEGLKLLRAPSGVTIVAGDMCEGDLDRLKRNSEDGADTAEVLVASSVRLQVGQAGTVSRLAAASRRAADAGAEVTLALSRDGEDGSSAMADVALGLGATFFHAGSPRHNPAFDRLLDLELALQLQPWPRPEPEAKAKGKAKA